MNQVEKGVPNPVDASDLQVVKRESNPVWEEISPFVWRNSIYSEEASSNCMGQLFKKEIELFKSVATENKQKKKILIEVGQGTAELFSKVLDDYEMLVGVEINAGMNDLAFEIHENLRESDKVKLINGNGCELNSVLEENGLKQDLDDESVLKVTCMCMNTFGILPTEYLKKTILQEMFKASGAGGKMIIGCWYQDALKTGFNEYYTANPKLCGECKESDFDFEKGNFLCSATGYHSHWWSEQELKDLLTQNFPGDLKDLTLTFKVMGVGIFAMADIAPGAKF